MRYTIDRPTVRLLFRVAGVPITLLAILGAIDSIGLLLGGLEKNNPWPVFFGLGGIAAYFGIAGAWVRISNTYESLPKEKIRLIRWLLICGVIGSLLLAAGTFGIFGSNIGYGAVIFIVLGAVGAVFLKQTPSQS